MRTNEYLVTLTLNETGRKAIGAYTKVLTILSEDGNITKEMIEDMFPLSLVESYDIQKSFGNLEKDDYVVFLDPWERRHLGKVSYLSGKRIMVENLEGYGDYRIEFNQNGVQATHSKSKHILIWVDPEEIDRVKRARENGKFARLLEMLNSCGAGIQFKAEDLVLPDWLPEEKLNYVLETLEGWEDKFYHC